MAVARGPLGYQPGSVRRWSRRAEDVAGQIECGEQILDATAQGVVAAAGGCQVGLAFRPARQIEGRGEDCLHVRSGSTHGAPTSLSNDGSRKPGHAARSTL